MAEETKIIYKKICANPRCKHGFDFTSTSRNQKYCCQECSDIARGINRAKAKKRKQKRKEYDECKEINQALNRCYGLAHIMAEKVYQIPKVCDISGLTEADGVDMELHHKDSNPFNNTPGNLVWLAKSYHKAYHDRQVDINMVTTWKEAQETEDPIAYLQEKLSTLRPYEEVKQEVIKDLLSNSQ